MATATTTETDAPRRLRVVFMGTPVFSVPALDALHAAHDVVAVYSQPDKPVGRGLELQPPPVKKRALELGLPVHQPAKLTLAGEYEKLAELKPDVIVVVAYGQILKKNVLELPRLGCVNIHSSLLPRWRGAAPIHHAILAGDSLTGVTTMKMVEKLDAGETYLKEEIAIGPHETVTELHDRLAAIGGQLIGPTLAGLDRGALRGEIQDESKVTYASKLTKEMERLDPERTAAELDRAVRALNPWPGTSFFVEIGAKPERIKVRQAVPHENMSASVGELSERAGMLVLGTARGCLELKRLQPEGKKEMDAASFVNGLRGRGAALPLRLSSG